jgi:dTDP-glucose 4,6-dehydratase
MPRSLVTGGAGFVGSHLVDRLLGEGHEVVCVDNFITGARENVAHLEGQTAFTLVEGDVSEPLEAGGKLDYIFHLASPASPVDFTRIPLEIMEANTSGTLNTLELAARAGARYVFASSSEVYGDPQVNPQPERYRGNVNTTGPRSVYDEAKRFGEAATAAYRRHKGLDAKIVRIFNTYGPRMRPDDGRVVPTFASQALRGEDLTVFGDGTQTRSFTYVDDLVEGIYGLATSEIAGPVNIGNPREITILELAERVLRIAGSRSELRFEELPQDDPRVRRPDIGLARSALGWEPKVGLDEGLERTLPYFREVLAGGGRPGRV